MAGECPRSRTRLAEQDAKIAALTKQLEQLPNQAFNTARERLPRVSPLALVHPPRVRLQEPAAATSKPRTRRASGNLNPRHSNARPPSSLSRIIQPPSIPGRRTPN